MGINTGGHNASRPQTNRHKNNHEVQNYKSGGGVGVQLVRKSGTPRTKRERGS